AAKYKDQGLVVIGVHTPEFSFEKDLTNVRQAMPDIRINFPVAVDSRYAIWNAFRNKYWPALYFIDARGQIRHHQFGEGDYQRSEKVIQQLLTEAGHSDFSQELVVVDAGGAEAAADWANLKSPESYLGYEQTQSFASAGSATPDRSHVYTIPAQLRTNEWAPSRDWTLRTHTSF